jgi:hypothetical protein
MTLLEGTRKITAQLGQRRRKSLMAIAVVALFVLNLNGIVAATALSSSLGSVGNYVWIDASSSGIGIQESSEVGINDVELELWLDDGDSVFELNEDMHDPDWTRTTANNAETGNPGWHLFDGLSAGTYFVRIAPAEFDSGGTLDKYTATAPNQGSDDIVDSDGDNPTCPYSPTIGSQTCPGGDSQYEDNLLATATLTEDAEGKVDDDLTIDFGVVPVAYEAPAAPTAVTLSSFMASSASQGASHWPWSVVLATLAAGDTLWIRRR